MRTRSTPRRGALLAATLTLMLVAGTAAAAPGAAQSPRGAGIAADAGTEVFPEDTGYAVVTFVDPPAAQYTGGLRGLRATKAAEGARFDASRSEVRAYRAHLAGVHGDFERWLARTAAGARVVESLSIVSNSVAVELNGIDAAALRRGPGVRSVEPAGLYRPTMNASVEVIGADDVWPSLGGRADAGAGIKIGIIDSGIHADHPFFACEVEGGNKLIGARTYASGVSGFGPGLVFDHGTHVAGTVAGCVLEAGAPDAPEYLGEGDAISGVAPGAQLFDYNVFPGFGGGFVAFGGSAFSHDIAAALEDAVIDGMDVVNLSLGGTQRGPNDYLDEALNATVEAGVVAVVSAGNEGPGTATVGSPGTAARAITVGATTNSHIVGSFITVTPESDDEAPEPFAGAAGDFDPFANHKAVDVALADWAAEDPGRACTPLPAETFPGEVVLVDRGDCTFGTKVRNAEAAGAVGVLIVNNIPGEPGVGPANDGGPVPSVGVLGISYEQGAAVRDVLPATVTITGELEEAPDVADVLAAFSSRGPTPFTRALKPEIVAPGVNIVSSVFTLGVVDGAFAYEHGWSAFQGTSMAAPHVAGAAALLLDAAASKSIELSPAEVKSALVNRAEPLSTELGDYSVLEQGAGRLDVPAAVGANVFASPAVVSFGHVTGNTNRAIAPVTIALSGAGATDCTADVDGAAVAASVASGGVTLDVSVVGPTRSLATGPYEGVVTVSCGASEETEDLRIPWYLVVERSR